MLSRSPLSSRPFRSPSLSRMITIRSIRGNNRRRYGMGSDHQRRTQRCRARKNQSQSSRQPLGPHARIPCVSRRCMRARHLFCKWPSYHASPFPSRSLLVGSFPFCTRNESSFWSSPSPLERPLYTPGLTSGFASSTSGLCLSTDSEAPGTRSAREQWHGRAVEFQSDTAAPRGAYTRQQPRTYSLNHALTESGPRSCLVTEKATESNVPRYLATFYEVQSRAVTRQVPATGPSTGELDRTCPKASMEGPSTIERRDDKP